MLTSTKGTFKLLHSVEYHETQDVTVSVFIVVAWLESSSALVLMKQCVKKELIIVRNQLTIGRLLWLEIRLLFESFKRGFTVSTNNQQKLWFIIQLGST